MEKLYRAALIGCPVYHSKSPNIYARLFKENNLCGSFTVLNVPPQNLCDLRILISSHRLNALAVTMPHKTAVINYVDKLTEDAKLLESVNFINIKNGKLYGYSTDGDGFLLSLKEKGIDPCGKTALIYGYGGAAAAVAHALIKCGATVYIAGRNRQKSEILAKRIGADVKDGIDIADCDIFINATPLGMTGQSDFTDFSFLESHKRPLCVCDLIYSPPLTRLLQTAQRCGMQAVSGYGMLLHQAEIAFSIMTGNLSIY